MSNEDMDPESVARRVVAESATVTSALFVAALHQVRSEGGTARNARRTEEAVSLAGSLLETGHMPPPVVVFSVARSAVSIINALCEALTARGVPIDAMALLEGAELNALIAESRQSDG